MTKAVLFDLDGTLVDTSEFIFQAYEHALKKHKLSPVPRDKIRQHIGMSIEECYKAFAPNYAQIEALIETHYEFQGMNLGLIAEFFGAHEVLKMLKEKFKLGIITSRRGNVVESLEIAKIDKDFDVIITAEHTVNHKPHPEPILLALSKLGFKPGQAVMVGDGVADIKAAKAAKLKGVIGVSYGFGKLADLKALGADYITDDIRKLPELIEQI